LPQGRIAAAEAMASARSHERLAMEKHLGILGTLGNNCPFIGLFGTVLGIIQGLRRSFPQSGGGPLKIHTVAMCMAWASPSARLCCSARVRSHYLVPEFLA